MIIITNQNIVYGEAKQRFLLKEHMQFLKIIKLVFFFIKMIKLLKQLLILRTNLE